MNKKLTALMTVAAALASCPVSLAEPTPNVVPEPERKPRPNLGRLPHQSTREIERRKRQMARKRSKP